jgi:hypothetical protein
MENTPNSKRGLMSGGVQRVAAIIGFIAILGIGMWGSVQVARAVPGALSNLASAIVSLTSIFVPADETLTLSVPSLNIEHNKAFVLSWSHEKKTVEGSYRFRFDCADGVRLTALNTANGQDNVFCNVPFNFVHTNNTITLTAFSDTNRFADVTVYVDFTPNGANQPTVTGKTTLTLTNPALGSSPAVGNPTTPSTPVTPTTPTTPTTPSTPTTPTTPGTPTNTTITIPGSGAPVSNPNGYVDLVPKIIEVGVVDKSTGAFTASSSPSRKDRIAVRFSVENQGTKTSNQFAFNAVLPTIPSYIYSSPMQQELRPKDRIEFTIGFDSFDITSNGQFTVNVDPTGSIQEKNEENNIIKYTIVSIP